MDCTCSAEGDPELEHYMSCPYWEPPLSYQEIRQLRTLLRLPAREAAHRAMEGSR